MKYLKEYKLFESVNKQEIHDTCKKYGIENYTINTNGSIDVNDDVNLYNKGLTKLPVNFRSVSGSFYCFNNNLTNLEGAPSSVDGGFFCYNNKLTSLLGAPSSVSGDFYCHGNKLTSLEGAPSSVSGDFYCYNNKLTSLEGAPSSVSGDFFCRDNQLTNLGGLEWKSFRTISLRNNPVHLIVKDWINKEDRIDLIEYFIDMNVIQDGDDKPKLILPRLEAFYEEINLKMDINFEEVKKYYEIIE